MIGKSNNLISCRYGTYSFVSLDALKKHRVSPEHDLKACLLILDGLQTKTLLVMTGERVLGTITDGDIRRGLIADSLVDGTIRKISRSDYTHVSETTTAVETIRKLNQKKLELLPIIDSLGSCVGAWVQYQPKISDPSKVQAFILAGGLGERLRPLTDYTPKPLLKVGNTAIIDHTLRYLSQFGIKRSYISVNYLKDKIMDHLGNGSSFNLELEYLHETERLGTAGPLGLLQDDSAEYIIVMNGDLLSFVNYERMLDDHLSSGADFSLVTRTHETLVPYGVVEEREGSLVGFREKPVLRQKINCGIYIFNREVLREAPPTGALDMDFYIKGLLEKSFSGSCFHYDGYWLDIGTPETYARACKDWGSYDS